jgi:hypothetical protein
MMCRLSIFEKRFKIYNFRKQWNGRAPEAACDDNTGKQNGNRNENDSGIKSVSETFFCRKATKSSK